MSRILLIDDEDDLLLMYRVTLERVGHVVETTTIPHEALERVDQLEPDLIGIDWVIPGLNGEELLRRFRHHPQTHSTPILVISALMGLAERVRLLGADGFLGKPFKGAELVKTVESLLERRHHGAASSELG